jgi:alkaline phosphatase D
MMDCKKRLALLIICLFHLLINRITLWAQVPNTEPLTRIAFGSCNKENEPQPMWEYIMQNNPQLWIWLGDNVYGDTYSMDTLKQKYDQQKNNPDYQKLTASTPVIGVWDDHDYGINDGGKAYYKKNESQQLMLDFLGEPAGSERRTREGAYGTYTYGPAGKRVKVILLDARYFRDTLYKKEDVYQLNKNGGILGETQWQWLENELKTSTADIHLIASGIQMVPKEHRFEKWANFPKERKRLFNLIASTKAKGVILLSGDRHIAEISKYTDKRLVYPLYEVTASGLTHAADNNTGEPNKYRVGKLINVLNFGLMDIDWEASKVRLQIRGLENELLGEEQFTFR